MRGDEARAAEAGCAAYLTKPLDARALRDTLRRFLSIEAKVKPTHKHHEAT